MTADEWDSETDPHALLGCAKLVPTARKQRFFMAACCNAAFGGLDDERFWAALDVLELVADSLASPDTLAEPRRLADEVSYVSHAPHAYALLAASDHPVTALSVVRVVGHVISPMPGAVEPPTDQPPTEAAIALLVRDIFRNPYRPAIAIRPEWLSSVAVSLATEMYESGDFAAMPILADALEDAGCTDADVLGHCRGPGPHVRGCRVVDRVLGKGGPEAGG
jgi:hypothetical protein